MVLAMRIALCLTVGGEQCGVVLQFDYVVGVGIVGISPETHAISQHLIESKFKLKTVVLDLTLVDVRSLGGTIVGRY